MLENGPQQCVDNSWVFCSCVGSVKSIKEEKMLLCRGLLFAAGELRALRATKMPAKLRCSQLRTGWGYVLDIVVYTWWANRP